MTYRVHGEAHGTSVDEGGFPTLDAAQAYASSVIDGDVDSTVHIQTEGRGVLDELLSEYDAWHATRTELSALEGSEEGPPDPDDWADSDDQAELLLERIAPVIRDDITRLVTAAQAVIKSWESGNLAEAVNVLGGVLYDLDASPKS